MECGEHGSVARQPTPYHDEKGVSKGWHELQHKGWLFKSQERPPLVQEDGEGDGADERAGKFVAALFEGLGRPRALPRRVCHDSWLLLRCEESGFELRFDALQGLRKAFEVGHQESEWSKQFFSPYLGTMDSSDELRRAAMSRHRLIEAPSFAKAQSTSLMIDERKLMERDHIHVRANDKIAFNTPAPRVSRVGNQHYCKHTVLRCHLLV